MRDCSCIGRHCREAFAGARALHGDDSPLACHVVTTEHRDHPGRVGGVRHHVEVFLRNPPDDDVVEHRGVGFVKEVLVLGAARSDPVEIVRQARLQSLEGAGAFDTHGAEMAHVEHGGVVATSEVFGDGAFRVGKRHLPAAEINESGVESQVLAV